MSYFITTAKFDKMQDNGSVKRVSEKFIVDALTITEAVAITTENLQPYISGDFFTPEAKQSPIAEIMGDKECGRFYLVKVGFITIDEKTAKEKRTISQILVGAPDFKAAYDAFLDGMKGTMADFDIVSLAETPIVDFYPAKI